VDNSGEVSITRGRARSLAKRAGLAVGLMTTGASALLMAGGAYQAEATTSIVAAGHSSDCSVQVAVDTAAHEATANAVSGCPSRDPGQFKFTVWATRSAIWEKSFPQEVYSTTTKAPWKLTLPPPSVSCFIQIDFGERRSVPSPTGHMYKNIVGYNGATGLCPSGVDQVTTSTTLVPVTRSVDGSTTTTALPVTTVPAATTSSTTVPVVDSSGATTTTSTTAPDGSTSTTSTSPVGGGSTPTVSTSTTDGGVATTVPVATGNPESSGSPGSGTGDLASSTTGSSLAFTGVRLACELALVAGLMALGVLIARSSRLRDKMPR
jgi:hypothetical protein